MQSSAALVVHVYCHVSLFSEEYLTQRLHCSLGCSGVQQDNNQYWACHCCWFSQAGGQEGKGGQDTEGCQETFYDLCSFYVKIFPLLTGVLLLLSFGGPKAWATHIICLKIDPQPFWVSLWNLFPNNCLWVFIRTQVGWTQCQQWGPCTLIGYGLFLGRPWQGQSRVFIKLGRVWRIWIFVIMKQTG